MRRRALAHRPCAIYWCGIGDWASETSGAESGVFCRGVSRAHACGSPGAEMAGRNVVSALYGIIGYFDFLLTRMWEEDLRCQKCLF